MRSVSDYVAKGEYSAFMQGMSVESASALGLGRAFYSVLVSRCYGLASLAPESSSPFLEVYLTRFVVENIKRILRAIHAGAMVDRDSLIPVSKKHGIVDLQAIIDAPTVEEAVATLKETPFSDATKALPIYQKYGLMSIMEAALDRTYFDSGLLPSISTVPDASGLREMMALEADLTNIRTMTDLRAREVASGDVGSLSFTPFLLRRTEVAQIAQSRIESIPEIVSRSHYAALAEPLREALDAGKEESLDRVIRSEIHRRAKIMMVRHSQDLAYALGYMIEAEAEADNLISIATGKELGLEGLRIERALCM